MIRRWISNFIRKNRAKINDLLSKLGTVAVFVIAAMVVLSTISLLTNRENDNEDYNVYKPTDAIIKGSDISEEQYQKDSNTVSKFLDFCNNKKIEDAYNLLSDECKEAKYHTLEEFEKNYHSYVFNKKRDYNIQAWISTSKFTVYKIRYTNDMMSTGRYEEDNVYQDYITLYKKEDVEKISIGEFITSEKCEFKFNSDELEIINIKRNINIFYEEYEIKIKNKLDTTVLLDPLNIVDSIKLITSNGSIYGAAPSDRFVAEFMINPNEIKVIKIKFEKNYSADTKSEEIEFSEFIKDYYSYIKDEENTNKTKITVKLED